MYDKNVQMAKASFFILLLLSLNGCCFIGLTNTTGSYKPETSNIILWSSGLIVCCLAFFYFAKKFLKLGEKLHRESFEGFHTYGSLQVHQADKMTKAFYGIAILCAMAAFA